MGACGRSRVGGSRAMTMGNESEAGASAAAGVDDDMMMMMMMGMRMGLVLWLMRSTSSCRRLPWSLWNNKAAAGEGAMRKNRKKKMRIRLFFFQHRKRLSSVCILQSNKSVCATLTSHSPVAPRWQLPVRRQGPPGAGLPGPEAVACGRRTHGRWGSSAASPAMTFVNCEASRGGVACGAWVGEAYITS